MGTRHLYLARHGEADPFGETTPRGRQQAALLGQRLAGVPIDAVWHSPLPRAALSAHHVARRLPGDPPVAEAAEAVDHVPYVPTPSETPAAWRPLFDGYDAAEAADGHRTAAGLVTRFAAAPDTAGDTHELVITHAYPIAWLVRHALDAPAVRWLGLDSANAGLTLIEYRSGMPPTLVMFNDLGHLPAELRWTGFAGAIRP